MSSELFYILLVAGGLILGILVSLALSWARKESAGRQVRALRRQAEVEKDNIIKEAKLSAKGELFAMREAFDKETQEARQELRKLERRLVKREDGLDHKADIIGKKEKYLENAEREQAGRKKRLAAREEELNSLIDQEKNALYRISGMNRDQAVEFLMKRLESEVRHEAEGMISQILERAREEADREAKTILATAIQRCSVDHSAQLVVSTVGLPNDEMKGRVIGREGRNIRAFEKATGIDVIVDDTPGVIVISGFDAIRREVARRALGRLVQDGRIHPGRIEEVVAKANKEVKEEVAQVGRQTCLDVDVHGVHPKEVELIGRLKYRTSYGQNVLNHSIEVAHLCGILAAELDLDPKLAKRIGLLHDIGKAIDHEVEGGHAQIGADVAKRHDERHEVVNAIAAHHEQVPAESVYAVLCQVGDALSASRPGARRESLEKYIKRLEKLEDLARSFPGVDTAFAIQAGREVRVIVRPDKVEDRELARLSRDIANEVEKELTYPGEITVTVVRETRAVEMAH